MFDIHEDAMVEDGGNRYGIICGHRAAATGLQERMHRY